MEVYKSSITNRIYSQAYRNQATKLVGKKLTDEQKKVGIAS